MPIYEYECSACKFYVEVLQKISEGPLKKCPSCKKPTMKRLISAPVFRLKGAGWYETDFKSENEEKRNLAEREEPAEAKADDKGDKKEAKPEEKEAKPAEVKPVDKSEARKLAAKKGPQGKPAAKAVAKPAPKSSKPKPVAKAPAKKKKKAVRRR